MGAKKGKLDQNQKVEHETSLVGTSISVTVVVGAVILFTYIVLYGLYMSRL